MFKLASAPKTINRPLDHSRSIGYVRQAPDNVYGKTQPQVLVMSMYHRCGAYNNNDDKRRGVYDDNNDKCRGHYNDDIEYDNESLPSPVHILRTLLTQPHQAVLDELHLSGYLRTRRTRWGVRDGTSRLRLQRGVRSDCNDIILV
jgi:hypothetical protein